MPHGVKQSIGPRMPRGTANRILAAMRPGEVLIVRPEYVISFRKTAREMGRRVITNAYWTPTGEKRIRMTAVRKADWVTGHIFQRMPVRSADDGRFMKDAAA